MCLLKFEKKKIRFTCTITRWFTIIVTKKIDGQYGFRYNHNNIIQ
jgi:hypothetical protein